MLLPEACRRLSSLEYLEIAPHFALPCNKSIPSASLSQLFFLLLFFLFSSCLEPDDFLLRPHFTPVFPLASHVPIGFVLGI
ncbi:hypothetical protein BJX99DRAFT_114519 [Aspergillus californicus]